MESPAPDRPGRQADVWLAEDRQLGQDVVLKVFRRINDPVAMERMRREVRLGRELRHPGLVRIFDLVEMSGFLVTVMEWVPGGSLAGLLEETGLLSIHRLVEIAGQVLETLAYLHGEGVIHRDIKPSNLLLAAPGLPGGRRVRPGQRRFAHERRWLHEAAAAGTNTWYGRRAAKLLAHLPAGERDGGSAS